RFRRFQVDDQIKFGRIPYGKLRWLGAFKDACGIVTNYPVYFIEAWSIGKKTASKRKLSTWLDGWQFVLQSQTRDLLPPTRKERVVAGGQSTDSRLGEVVECFS